MSGTRDLSQDELRSARTPWATPPHPSDSIAGSFRCEVLIVGGGITGALLAERLTRDGRDVVIVDREDPARGSTLASTAMLLGDIDRSLSELVALYGFERAVRAYQASHAATRGLIQLISRLEIDCAMRPRNALYLAAGEGRFSSGGNLLASPCGTAGSIPGPCRPAGPVRDCTRSRDSLARRSGSGPRRPCNRSA
jgi:NAD(P)-dependent dehydrogenase (short-subunit alcohol dehydrogenase family)